VFLTLTGRIDHLRSAQWLAGQKFQMGVPADCHTGPSAAIHNEFRHFPDGDRGAAEPEHQPPGEIEPQRASIRLTGRVPWLRRSLNITSKSEHASVKVAGISWSGYCGSQCLDAARYEDVNDAEWLCRHLAMRWVVGGRAPMGPAASASQMGPFERVADSAGKPHCSCRAAWPMDRHVHGRRSPRIVVFDMDLSESPTAGERLQRSLRLHLRRPVGRPPH
jgi:hypothetical protein